MGKSSELLTICSANHQKILIEGVWSSFISKHRTDLDVTCNGHMFGAHQLIMDVFFPSFTSPNTSHLQGMHKSIDLSFALEDKTDLHLLLEFIYRGQVTIDQQQMQNLLGAAKNLNIQTLVEAIENCQVGRQFKEVKFVSQARLNVDDTTIQSLESNLSCPLDVGVGRQKWKPVKFVKVWDTCTGTLKEGDHSMKRRRRPPNPKTVRVKSVRPPAVKRRSLRKMPHVNKLLVHQEHSKLVEMSDECGLNSDDTHETTDGSKSAYREVDSEELDKDDNDTDSQFSSGSQLKQKIKKRLDPQQPVARKKLKSNMDNHLMDDQKLTRSEYKKLWRQTRPMQSCPNCAYETRDKIRYNIHLAKHDSSVVIFKCESCGRIFQSQESLVRHELTHLGTQVYHCSQCQYSSPKKINFHRHITAIHKVAADGKPLEDKYRCSECTFVCMYKSQYKLHLMMKHSSEKPFQCQDCSYASIRKGDLEKHVSIVHLHSRPFLCDLCGFCSTHKGALNRHKRTHTKAKPYRCVTCNQEYADSHKLKNHMQRHVTDDKPFVCQLCAKSCRRRDNLQMHMKRIHKTSLDNVVL